MKTKEQQGALSHKKMNKAYEWLIRIKEGAMTPDQKTEFETWQSENPINEMELDILSAIWDRTDDLKDNPLVETELDTLSAIWDYTDELNDDPLVAHEKFLTRVCLQFSSLKRWFGGIFTGMTALRPVAVAVTVILVVLVLWMFQNGVYSPIEQPKSYHSKLGEQKTIPLEDGSTVLLDTATLIYVEHLETARRIDLVRGRALFSVAHNPERPFIVTAGDLEVRAIGTEFDVSKGEKHKVTVAVLEGLVRVRQKRVEEKPVLEKKSETNAMAPYTASEKNELSENIVAPGEKILVDTEENSIDVQVADIDYIKAWRNGIFDFDAAPLSEIITEVNRYLHQKIIIGDDDLKNKQITLIYDISECKNFLVALKKILPVIEKETPTGEILLVKK